MSKQTTETTKNKKPSRWIQLEDDTRVLPLTAGRVLLCVEGTGVTVVDRVKVVTDGETNRLQNLK